jgi:hypothetical protein
MGINFGYFRYSMYFHMNNLKSNAQRAKIALTLVWIVFGLEILALFSGIVQYNLLQKAANVSSIISISDALGWLE